MHAFNPARWLVLAVLAWTLADPAIAMRQIDFDDFRLPDDGAIAVPVAEPDSVIVLGLTTVTKYCDPLVRPVIEAPVPPRT